MRRCIVYLGRLAWVLVEQTGHVFDMVRRPIRVIELVSKQKASVGILACPSKHPWLDSLRATLKVSRWCMWHTPLPIASGLFEWNGFLAE